MFILIYNIITYMLLYEQECLSLSYWWNIMMALVRWCKEVPQVVIKLAWFGYVVMFMEKP